MKFHLDAFISKVNKGMSIPEDQVSHRIRTLQVFRMILDHEKATPELLSRCTEEELEWVFDFLLYWPSWEQEIEPEDMNHEGVQHVKMRELIHQLSKKKSIKRKVTFI